MVPGGGSPRTPLDNVKVDSVLVAMSEKTEYSLDKFEKIRIKVGLVLVAICDKTEYTN